MLKSAKWKVDRDGDDAVITLGREKALLVVDSVNLNWDVIIP